MIECMAFGREYIDVGTFQPVKELIMQFDNPINDSHVSHLK